MTTRRCCVLVLTLCWGTAVSRSPLAAGEPTASPPLHQRIDALLDAARVGPVAAPADDAQFLRRVTLDLAGRIPTVAELRAFLADESPDKRARKIDELLAGPEYPQHMAVVFDLMLMERRGGQHVKTEEFRQYLQTSFAENKPYHQLAKELLGADGTEEKNRSAAAFYLERDVEPTLLTRELGRVFFGVDLQCAQCHDHPLIDDYRQSDYYGLNAFVVRASLFRPDNKQPGLVAEKADGEAAFKSVFTDREGVTGPRIPEGEEVIEPVLKTGEQYVVEPAKDVRPVPRFSRLAKLAEVVGAGNNRAFDRNIANRLWAQMFGRGLVHPVDLHHSDNPPSHPEVMDLIAAEFAAMNYNVKAFLRELALTQAYQRSYQLPADLTPAIDAAREQIAQLEAQAAEGQQQAQAADQRVDEITHELDAAVAEMKRLRDAVNKANQGLAEALKKLGEAAAKLAEARKAADDKNAQARTVEAAVTASRQAAETLKDDKELATAAAMIHQRFEALSAEVAKLQAAVDAQQKAVDDATAKRSAADAATDAAIAQLTPVEEKVRGLRVRLNAMRDEAMAHRRGAVVARRQVETLQTLVTYGEQQAEIARLQQEIPETETALAQAEQRARQSLETLAGKKAVAEQAGKELTQSQELLKQAQVKLAESQQTSALLKESLAKAGEAQARLGEGNELATAVAALTSTAESVQTRIQQEEKLVVERQNAVAEQTKVLEAATAGVKIAETEHQEAAKQVGAVRQKLTSSREELAALRKAHDATWGEIVDQATARFNVAAVSPLSPEQFGASVLFATGQAERHFITEKARLDKEQPLSGEEQTDPAKTAGRERQAREAAFAAVLKSTPVFVNLFAAGKGQPQQDFFATADQALFFANGNEVRSWLTPGGGNLTERLGRIEDASELTEELYLSILCRMPNQQERDDVATYLAARQEQRAAAIQELAWALITSAEFRFQH